jgi:sugar/nucleoside kinase (ribokinase family)
MGLNVAVVTSVRHDDPVLADFPAIPLARVQSETSSVFVNEYIGNTRKQILRSRAQPLTFDDVPGNWRESPIVHLAPLTDEVDPALARAFPNALVAVTPQGWMRQWDSEGVISFKPWEHADTLLPIVGACILSEEDIHRDRALEAHYASLANMLVVTRAENGCTIYRKGHERAEIPALRVDVVDATGAGDIFAGIFLTLFHRTQDALNAARVACRLASISVTRVGLAGLPEVGEIEAALHA